MKSMDTSRTFGTLRKEGDMRTKIEGFVAVVIVAWVGFILLSGLALFTFAIIMLWLTIVGAA